MTISSEDIKTIEKFVQIKNKGLYCSGAEVTAVYNRCLGKNLASTSCGACIRARIQELENALLRFKQQLEVNNTSEEKEELTEPSNESKKGKKGKKTK